MKKYFFLALLVIMVCAGQSVFAQESVQNDQEQDIEGEVENLAIEIIADTNARNLYAVELDQNVFGVGFDIINEWDKTQPGVKHAIELYASDEKGGYLVDKIVYADVDSLVPGQSIHKELMYSIPQGLPLDQYVLRVVLTSEKGLLLSLADAGIVEKNEQTGIYVDPSTCYLKIGDEKFALVQGVDVAEEEQLELVCESIKNLDGQSVSAFAYTTTKKRTSFGETVDEKEIAKEDFSAGENKQVTYVIEKVIEPQAYEGRFALRFNGQDVSNNIIFRYVVQGESATAQNATTDKDHYESGDIAKVSLMTSGMASSYPGARDQNMGEYLTNAPSLVAKIKIVDVNGQTCSEEQIKEFDGLGENVQIEVPIKKDCQGPTVITQIQNQEGVVLDEANFAVEPSASNTDTTTSAEGKNNTNIIIAIAIAMIPLFVLAIYFIFRKKSYKNETGMKTFLFLVILCGSFFLMNIDSVNAASFTTGNYHCFTLNSVKGYCVVNGSYDIPNGTDCTNTNAYASMQWSACSNMTIDARLYINGSRVWRDTNTNTGGSATWLSRNSGWKSKNLGKLSAGNYTIPFRMTFYHDWHDWNFNRRTEVINASKSFSVSRCATNGACGPRHGKTGEWTTADLGRYAVCNSGTLEWISGLSSPTVGRWEWRCKGSNGGSDSGTCWAKPPTVNGACSTGKITNPILYTQTAWSSTAPTHFCATGTPSPNPPTFPSYGTTATWTCLGSGPNHTDSSECSVTRQIPPPCECEPGITGGTKVPFNETQANWITRSFCEYGDPIAGTPTLPNQGQSVSWICGGQHCTDPDANCTATRGTPPPCICGPVNGSNFDDWPSTTDLCTTGTFNNETSNENWTWDCGTNDPMECVPTAPCTADCVEVEIDAPANVYLKKNGNKLKVKVRINTGSPSQVSGGTCDITVGGVTKSNIALNGNSTNEVEFDFSGSTTIDAVCTLDVDCGGDGTSAQATINATQRSVRAVCAAKSCNAQGTCQTTPVQAESLTDSQCTSSCNSNADCSSGRIIEAKP